MVILDRRIYRFRRDTAFVTDDQVQPSLLVLGIGDPYKEDYKGEEAILATTFWQLRGSREPGAGNPRVQIILT